MAEQTLNIPSILILILVTSFVVRYLFFRDRSTSSAATSRRVDPTHVTQISSMFPQVDPRAIQWDLQRNGGSVQATTERILTRGRLDEPPPSFRPQLPTILTTSTASPTEEKPRVTSLITRYNLGSRIAEATGVGQPETPQSQNTSIWSSNRNERQALLQRRRDEMVLAARRKLEEKSRSGS